MNSGLLRRLAQLYIGLTLYGLSAGLLVRSRLGLDPWDVLHQGIARHTGIKIGTVLIIVGAVVLLGWIPLRQRPGLGTLSNLVLIGVALNLSLTYLPSEAPLAVRWAEMLGGIGLCGVATGMYIGANFGPGPRDGLMTGLARRTGRSIRFTRTAIELTVLTSGWLLGGNVGIGTVLFALLIGPLAQRLLPLFDTSARPTLGVTLEAVVGDRLPGGSVGNELAVTRASAGIDVKGAHPHAHLRPVLVSGEEMCPALTAEALLEPSVRRTPATDMLGPGEHSEDAAVDPCLN
jgi:uncharacterized membrane protein YczE